MVANQQQIHEKIGRVQIKGVDAKDKVIVHQLDYTGEDHSLMLPLWAGVPDKQQAQVMINRTILNAGRFDRPFGIPACSNVPDTEADSTCSSVYLPWNQLICEGYVGLRIPPGGGAAGSTPDDRHNPESEAKARLLPTLSRR